MLVLRTMTVAVLEAVRLVMDAGLTFAVSVAVSSTFGTGASVMLSAVFPAGACVMVTIGTASAWAATAATFAAAGTGEDA